MSRRVSAASAALVLSMTSVSGASAQSSPTSENWRHGGVCYEVFVRSFYDSDGDGVGDLKGLTARLDYINDGNPATTRDLGARCIWLMPIMPSPSYHGYDVIDYYGVNPVYGTEQDFRDLVEAAHRRGIAILVDMVPNHSSSEHPWFKNAALHPHSPYRDWYRWSDVQGPPNEWGGQNWHHAPYGDDFYYGFFSGVMPDLNWSNPAVADEFDRISDFWLKDMGVDGFRLDAVRHLMEDSVSSANVPATHDVLRRYEAHIREVAPRAFTVGEVNDSTDVLRTYYPDQLDSYFAFQVANAILGAVKTGSSGELLAAVEEMHDVDPGDLWAPFLRNHDQSRTMTWLQGDVARNKLAASLLLTLPGIPFVYYGEELGMEGDKPDPRIRTPMQWDLSHAAGFTTGLAWEPLQDDSLTANVSVQDPDPSSILNHYRRLIHLRSSSPALGSGVFIPLEAATGPVAAYLRKTDDDVALVVANLGETPLEGVRLSSAPGVLARGRYEASLLLGAGAPAVLRVGRDGRLSGYAPLGTLEPLQAVVVHLAPPGGESR